MHWRQSGFANTDLDAQLKQREIEKIILVGFVTNTCIKSTARFGMELGYHVTLIKDATAAFEPEGMHAAHEFSGPRVAHDILATQAAGPTAVLIQIQEVGHVLVAVV
jgi:nicotinamidase-related amidase